MPGDDFSSQADQLIASLPDAKGSSTAAVATPPKDFGSEIDDYIAKLPNAGGGFDPDTLRGLAPQSAGKSVDCSLFTQNVYKQLGVGVPRTAIQQYWSVPHVDAPMYDPTTGRSTSTPNTGALKPGDLMFWDTLASHHSIEREAAPGVYVTHVGIYMGNGMMLHNPGTGRTPVEVPVAGYASQFKYVGSGRPEQGKAYSYQAPPPPLLRFDNGNGVFDRSEVSTSDLINERSQPQTPGQAAAAAAQSAEEPSFAQKALNWAGSLIGAVNSEDATPAEQQAVQGDYLDKQRQFNAAIPQLFPDMEAGAMDKFGQVAAGAPEGWFKEEPLAKDHAAVTGLAQYLIPGWNTVVGTAGISGVADTIGTKGLEGLKQVGSELYDSVNYAAPDISPTERATRMATLGLYVLGGLHLKGMASEKLLRRQLTTKFGLDPGDASAVVDATKNAMRVNNVNLNGRIVGGAKNFWDYVATGKLRDMSELVATELQQRRATAVPMPEVPDFQDAEFTENRPVQALPAPGQQSEPLFPQEPTPNAPTAPAGAAAPLFPDLETKSPSALPAPQAAAATAEPLFPDEETVNPAGRVTTSEPGSQAPQYELTPQRDLAGMTSDQLYGLRDQVAGEDKATMARLFGAEGVKKYQMALRMENSMDSARSQQGSDLRDQMEAGLSDAQRAELFRIGDTHYLGPDELRDYASSAADIENARNAPEIGFAISKAMEDVKGGNPDPHSVFQILKAEKRAKELGLDPQSVIDAGVVARLGISGRHALELLDMSPDEVNAAAERFRQSTFAGEETKPSQTIASAPKGTPATSAEGIPFERTEVPPTSIGVYPGLQYKRAGIIDSENGITDALKGAQKYDQAAGPLTVWRTRGGSLWVMNGHHRRELAIRTGEPKVPVNVFHESDGIDFAKARALGALQNLRDGKGTAIDAVTVLRDLGWTKNELEQVGVNTRSGVARDANSLLKLSPDALQMVGEGDVPEAVAAGIADAGLDPRREVAAMKEAARGGLETRNQGAILADRARTAPMVDRSGGNGDLFGELDESLALAEQAKIAENAARRLTRNQRLLEAMNRGIKAGSTIVDSQAQTAAAQVQEFGRKVIATDPETSAILEQEAKAYAANPTKKQLEAGTDRVVSAAERAAESRLSELDGRGAGGADASRVRSGSEGTRSADVLTPPQGGMDGLESSAPDLELTSPETRTSRQSGTNPEQHGLDLGDEGGLFAHESKEPLAERASSLRKWLHQIREISPNYEPRPGTNEKQLRDGTEVLSSLRRIDAELLGCRIIGDFIQHSGTRLVGQRVGSAADLAGIAQFLRNPKIEIFRLVFVDDDRVVATTAVSSRLTGSTATFAGVKPTGREFERWLRDMITRSGANGFYALHNHPSGRSEPSHEDSDLTVQLARSPFFQRHVVIDHNEYSVIDRFGQYETFEKRFGPDQDPLKIPAKDHQLIGVDVGTSADLAALGAELAKGGRFHVIGVDARGIVNGILEVPYQSLESGSPKNLLASLRRFRKFTGSRFAYAVVDPEMTPVDGGVSRERLTQAMQLGALDDAISVHNGGSLRDATNTETLPEWREGRKVWGTFVNEPGKGLRERGGVPGKDQLHGLLQDAVDFTGSVGGPLSQLRDMFIENLTDLSRLDPESARLARRVAQSRAEASLILRGAIPRINAAAGVDDYFSKLRTVLVESRLQGIRQRWTDMAGMVRNAPDASFEEDYPGLRGVASQLKVDRLVDSLIQQGHVDDAREILADAMEEAAGRVASVMPADELARELHSEPFIKALHEYKQLIEEPLARSHASNEGVFSDALGPAQTYYPLIPLDADGKPLRGSAVTKRPGYKKPANRHNKFATGLSPQYDLGVPGLADTIGAAVKVNNTAELIQRLLDRGLIMKVNPKMRAQLGDKPVVSVNGQAFEARYVPIGRDRTIIQGGHTVHVPAPIAAVPNWLASELQPVLDQTPKADWAKTLSAVAGGVNRFGMAGPLDAFFHSVNLSSALLIGTPYAGTDWISKTVGNTPVTKVLAGAFNLWRLDPMSAGALTDLHELSRIGALPGDYASNTTSRELSEQTGARLNRRGFGAWIYGPRGIDVRARIQMLRIAREINPKASPAELARFVNQVGAYNKAMEAHIERALKETQVSPFFTAGKTKAINAAVAWTGRNKMPLKGLSPADRIKFRLARSFGGGVLGVVVTWVLMHKALTGKWPWDDESSKFLELPVPDKVRSSAVGKAVWGPEDGKQAYVNMSFFAPAVGEGSRLFGVRGMYNTRVRGGTWAQAEDAGMKDSANALIRPATSGPALRGAFVAATGQEPFVTGDRDVSGGLGMKLLRVSPDVGGGVRQAGENLKQGVLRTNQALGSAAESVGLLSHPAWMDGPPLTLDQRALALSIAIALPGLVDPREDDVTASEKSLRRQADATARSVAKDAGESLPSKRLRLPAFHVPTLSGPNLRGPRLGP